MYHTVNFRAKFIKQFLYYRCICTSWRENKFSGINWSTLNWVCQFITATIYEFVRNSLIKTLRIFLGKILCKNVMTSTCQSVTAHTAVIFLFVCSLPATAKTNDYIAWTNVCIVNDITSLHTASDCRIHDDSTNKVAHICSFTTCCINSDTHLAHFFKKFIRAIDNSRNHFAWNEHLVAADSRRNENIVDSSHAEKVVCIHNESILCNSLPYRQIASLLPIHIRKT